jgi:hypothetical protein
MLITALRRDGSVFFIAIVVIAIIEVGTPRNNHVQQSDPFLLQLAISAWLTARYASRHGFLSTTERDRVHFLLFCSIWTTVLSPIFPILLTQELAPFVTGIAAHVILYATWLS